MVRKRIQDVIRQEAQKSSDLEDGSVIDITPEPDLETETPEATDVATTTHSRHTDPTKAELETTVIELETTMTALKAELQVAQEENSSQQQKMDKLVTALKAQLQAAQEENSSSRQKITSLQSDLQEQKVLVEKLQGELAEAKKTILQLSELNTKPVKNTVPAKNTAFLAKLPHHSYQPELPSSVLTDTDIGWVD